MNLADLSRLDLKDLQKIDYKNLLEKLRTRTDILLNLIIVVLSFMFVVNALKQSGQKVRGLKAEITSLEEKIAAIKGYEHAEKGLDEYLAKVPEGISGDQVVTLLTDLAVTHNIQIESVSPANTSDRELYSVISTQMTVTAENYKDLWLFIYDIEKSPQALCINRLEVLPENQYAMLYNQGGEGQENVNKIKASMDIASINVKIKNE